jgi:hypothetical protein
MTFLVDGTLGGTFPSWTTATRPASPAVGQMGYNTTTGLFDQYTAAGWVGGLTNASQSVPKSALPTGSVLQVVQGTSTSYSTWTNSTFTDTGLTASITPTSASSKILVLVTQRAYAPPGCSYGAIQLFRGATSLLTYNRLCLRDAATPGSDVPWNTIYLDSPATTSSTTYKTQAANTASNGTFYIGLDSNLQSITLMEIAA